ncbi:hypothetical protein CGLO_14017 [Colletotrichum gloeosporioides Cg-14]|uniref:Uncharacterized protein n=1 Tax=Colletotrichum gloeosporioides (strain Cg-14) TaxID=1237896 RepID=T0LET5_COLGC|nr:hypothetical protein CGLO_14017 [Colletotrichum gloeosporioides Cg-14]
MGCEEEETIEYEEAGAS